jgi:K+/H+ antiporter YhaU regulatory subunit KhtT
MQKGCVALKEIVSLPIYSKIALDIATRIARGELKENTKIYGRSVMSSEYGVSPETIRRSVKLLADMEIVEVQHNSGIIVLSKEKAKKYIERFDTRTDIAALQNRLNSLLEEQKNLNEKIVDAIHTIVDMNERFSRTNPFQNYELQIPENSPIAGKTIEELKFWQKTGATIIAIRRGEKIILSPGPYLSIIPMDMLIFVGDLTVPEAVKAYIGL